MANYVIAVRYSDACLPNLVEKYESEILGPVEPPTDASATGYRYFESIISLVGETKRKIEKTRDYEVRKRMAYTDVIYAKKHNNKKQLEKEYRNQLEESLLLNDLILIEPISVCNCVSRTIRLGSYFFFLCFLLTSGALFVGKFYRHKTYLTCTLFLLGASSTILYSNSYESWPIADFHMLPDPLLCGVYCSPAVIFRTEKPIAVRRHYDRYYSVNILYFLSVAAGLQFLYRIYQGLPPYLCPCTSKTYPEFPRYASLLFPFIFRLQSTTRQFCQKFRRYYFFRNYR